jgi:hypothetical protein
MSEPVELPPDVHTIDLWMDGRFVRRMSREVFEEERAIAELVMPLLREGLKYFEQVDTPPAALRGPSSSVPPNRAPIEDEREARGLVPLVRAAADEVPVGDVPHLPREERPSTLLGFHLRWEDELQQAMHDALRTAADDLVGQAFLHAPPPTPRSGADILAEIDKAYELIRAAPPPRTLPVFLTPKQFDLLKQHCTAPASPYDNPGVIGRLDAVQVVVMPERTRWQRFRAWLRRWRWWR